MPAATSTGLTQAGLNGLFFQRLAQQPTLYQDLCAMMTSGKSEEIYRWLGQLPMPRKWVGERQSQALRDFGQTIVNEHFEQTLKIDRDELDDDQTGQIPMRIADLATRTAQFPDLKLIDLIIAAEAAACYDGQYFFDTDHSEGESGTQSNDLTYDATSTTAPTAAEFKAAFWQAVKAIAGFKDDQGQPLNAMPSMEMLSNVAVLVPVSWLDVAAEVLGANAAAVLSQTTNILAGKAKVYTSARLTWTTKFATFFTGGALKPFIYQDRQKPVTMYKDDREHKDILYGVDFRMAVGYGAWQTAALTTLT